MLNTLWTDHCVRVGSGDVPGTLVAGRRGSALVFFLGWSVIAMRSDSLDTSRHPLYVNVGGSAEHIPRHTDYERDVPCTTVAGRRELHFCTTYFSTSFLM